MRGDDVPYSDPGHTDPRLVERCDSAAALVTGPAAAVARDWLKRLLWQPATVWGYSFSHCARVSVGTEMLVCLDICNIDDAPSCQRIYRRCPQRWLAVIGTPFSGLRAG